MKEAVYRVDPKPRQIDMISDEMDRPERHLLFARL